MQLYRLCRQRFAELSGLGAKLTGGRWNKRGVAALYTTSNASLAVLEVLVHLQKDEIPNDYVTLEISVPDAYILKVTRPDDPRLDSFSRNGFTLLKDSYAGFSVPSVIVPNDDVVVLYPEAQLGRKLSTDKMVPFSFDPRLFPSMPNLRA